MSKPAGPSRLVLRIYVVMLVAIASVVAILVFGRSRRDPPPFPGGGATFVVETLAQRLHEPEALARELVRARRENPFDIAFYSGQGALLATTIQPPPAAAPEQIHAAREHRPGPPPRDMVIAISDGGYAVVRFDHPRPRGPDFRFDVGLVLLSLGIASIVVASMIARPLNRVASAARRFGRGDLTARSQLHRRDELGELSRTFDEMADRLTQLLRGQRELLASVSHELRTPLSRIRVALDLAAEGDAEAAREALRDITEDLAELEELVNDVLAMARLDAQSVGPQPMARVRTQPIEAQALARKAAGRFTAGHPDRALELALGDEPLALEGDPNLLRRVLENLLENAHKYSAAGPPIALVLARQGDRAAFTVSDRGQGIAAEDLPFVFEPFFRADRSRARGTGGVGLGLALAKRVVEAHGGRIEIESQVDRGTTVAFSLPLAAAQRNIS